VEVVTDTASGMNDRRPGLLRLLDAVWAGQVERVVVFHRDRLSRFGTGILEAVFRRHGVELVELESREGKEFMQELAEDLVAVVQHFCARFYGARSHKYRRCVAEARRLGRELADP